MNDTNEGHQIEMGGPDDFEMFTNEGNLAVSAMVAAFVAEVEDFKQRGLAMTDRAATERLMVAIKTVASTKDETGEPMSEVWDTAVRDAIYSRIEQRTGLRVDI